MKFRNQADNLDVNEHDLYNISTGEWKILGSMALVQAKNFIATVQTYNTINSVYTYNKWLLKIARKQM